MPGHHADALYHVPSPRFFKPGQTPRFLLEAGLRRGSSTPRKVPTSVAAAAAVALAGPQAERHSRCRDTAEDRAWHSATSTGRGHLEEVPWPPRIGADREELLRHVSDALLLERDVRCDLGPEDGGTLQFGDAVRLLRTGDNPAVLSTAPPSCGGRAEQRIADELVRSGRGTGGYVAATAVPLVDTAYVAAQRNTWVLYRADPLDGFPRGSVVHYGQLLRIGQRPTVHGGDEVLLSCEPPCHSAGVGAPYLVLGRFAPFGHPDPRGSQRKTFDTAFRLLPTPADAESSGARRGMPVDLRRPLLLVPASPFAYLHGPRALRVVPDTTPNDSNVNNAGRTVVLSHHMGEQRRELLLEAGAPGQPSPGAPDPWTPASAQGWIIERLVMPADGLQAHAARSERMDAGLPRALLGRVLDDPPVGSYGAAVALRAPGEETSYARWEHLRRALLLRLSARGALGFAVFRRTLGSTRPAAVGHEELAEATRAPGADGARPARSDERCLLPIEDVASVLAMDYGVRVSDEDLALLAKVFAAGGEDGLLDGDVLADALRGEPSPGRQTILSRLYTQLQREEGVGEHTSLVVDWVEHRLYSAVPPNVPGQRTPDFMPKDLVGTLPLVRVHCGIPRAVFVRWMSDLAYLAPTHAEFVAFLREIWGAGAALDLASRQEERHWNFRHGDPPLPPQLPPYIGNFPPIAAGTHRHVVPTALGSSWAE